jgi:hypothetical protein
VVDGPVVEAPIVLGSEHRPARGRALIPALIALTSVLGAMGAWRASVASGAAGGAERKAFADTVAAEQQKAVIESVLGSIEFTYARKASLEAMAASLRGESETAAEESAGRLTAQADAYQAAADSLLIDADALRPDGSLDLQAKRDIEWALVADRLDLDPAPEWAEADAQRAKAERLVGLTALLIAAALFLTLAQVGRNPRARSLYLNGGVAVMVAATILLFLELA